MARAEVLERRGFARTRRGAGGKPAWPAGRCQRRAEPLHRGGHHGIVVAGLYLPNGNPRPGPKFDYKLAWMERLIRHAQTLVELPHPAVLMGDFNVIPTDIDVYDPKAWRKDALIQPEVRESFERLLAQGWTDALRQIAGERVIYTFWDYFRQHAERDRGLRIDHLLLNPALAENVKDAGVDRWVRLQPKASDHAPTWVTVRAPGAA
ncbi:exodeoxyribonuclease III [Lysobacter sp. F6437]|uniref:exodeoxyribonuclease III n=1 Tax=Lysobacter sp. F6437 TaxID=3459296 RepID=UPI00403D94BB